MCVCCQEAEAPFGLELCPLCEAQVRIEVAAGIYRMERYLARWAAFSDWERGARQVPTT